MTDEEYCESIPGGKALPIIDDPQSFDRESGFYVDDHILDSPVAGQVSWLISNFRSTAVIDIASLIDRDVLNKNTNGLNTFVRNESTRINQAVADIISNGVVSPENNGTGLPNTIVALKKIGAIYDNQNPDTERGLSRTALPNRSPFQNLYPDLADRLDLNPSITQAEIQQFIRTNSFDPLKFNNELRPGRVDILNSLNSFYSDENFSKSSMGAFCSLVPDIFAAFATARNVFDSISAADKYVESFTSGSFVGYDFKLTPGAVTALVDQLKNQVLTVVDQLAENNIKKIKNFTGSFIRRDYLYNMDALSTKLIREKEKALNFFSKENVERIKKKLSGAISYAIGVFERMDLEEIQFLILRFCELISQLERVFTSRAEALSGSADSYENAKTMLQSSSNLATARAIQAGAIRYDPPSLLDMQNLMSGYASSGPMSSSPYAYPGSTIPDDFRGVPVEVDPITPEELALLPSYEDIKNGNNLFALTGSYKMGAPGWMNAQEIEKIMLLRLAQKIGKKLLINSAWRSRSYNASLYGSARNSLHISGKAFDIQNHGGLSQGAFINMARSVGFSGFGVYRSFTHIDTGRPRSWSG